MKNLLEVSVVIPTLDRPKSLEHTLNSYLDKDNIPNQIIIVDQSSEENKELNYQLIKYYREITTIDYIFQKVPSITKARNMGLKYVKNDIVIFSDDDIEVFDNTLLNLYQLMANSQISMVAGIDNLSDKSSSSLLSYLVATKSFVKRKYGHVTSSVLGRYPDRIKGQIKTEWAMGFFFSVRKTLLYKYFLEFDEKLLSYAYAEDLLFSYQYYIRSKKDGYKCILDDSVRVNHLVSREYRQPSKSSVYMFVLHRAYIANYLHFNFCKKINMEYCDYMKMIYAYLKKENVDDWVGAIKYYHSHKRDVEFGHFFYGDN